MKVNILNTLLTYCDQICKSTLSNKLILYIDNYAIDINEMKNKLNVEQKFFY